MTKKNGAKPKKAPTESLRSKRSAATLRCPTVPLIAVGEALHVAKEVD